MSFGSKVKQFFFGEEKKVIEEVHRIELSPAVHKVEVDLKAAVAEEKTILKGAILQAIEDEKAALVNREGGLSADASAAVTQVVEAVIKVMVQDAL